MRLSGLGNGGRWPVTVTEDLDREVREGLRALLASTVSRLGMMSASAGDSMIWDVKEGSPASEAILMTRGTWDWVVAGLSDAGGADPVLTVAGGFLREAADGLALAGHIQTLTPEARVAGLGPVVRTAAEKLVTTAWLLDTESPEGRLARVVLMELDGIQWQMRYLEDAGEDQAHEELQAEHDGIVQAVEDVLGAKAVRRGSGKRVIRVAGEQLPTKTTLFNHVLSGDELNRGRAMYGEHSVFAHPTGYRQAVFSEPLRGVEGTQIVYATRSNVHDEGRLVEPALLALAHAMASVGNYIGQNLRPAATDLLSSAAELWQEWCMANGCAPLRPM
jgi:hypothetical protein